jgi:hypothetical protein
MRSASAAAAENARNSAAAAIELASAIKSFESSSSRGGGGGKWIRGGGGGGGGGGGTYDQAPPAPPFVISTASTALPSLLPHTTLKRGRDMDDFLAELMQSSANAGGGGNQSVGGTSTTIASQRQQYQQHQQQQQQQQRQQQANSGGDTSKYTSLYVVGIPSPIEEDEIQAAVTPLGQIRYVSIVGGKNAAGSAGTVCAFICFVKPADAAKALTVLERPGPVRAALVGGGSQVFIKVFWSRRQPTVDEGGVPPAEMDDAVGGKHHHHDDQGRDLNVIDIESSSNSSSRARGVDDASSCAPVVSGNVAASKLYTLLSVVTPTRASVSDAAIFALDNAEDAAGPVGSVLVKSLREHGVPPFRLLARLYVASDILASAASGVRGASTYRGVLGAALPDAFEELGAICCGTGASSVAQTQYLRKVLAERISRLLNAWSKSSLFPGTYLAGLEASFERSKEARAVITRLESGERFDESVSSGGGAGGASGASGASGAGGASGEGGSMLLTVQCALGGLSSLGGAAAIHGRFADLDAFLRAKFLGPDPLLDSPHTAPPTTAAVSSSMMVSSKNEVLSIVPALPSFFDFEMPLTTTTTTTTVTATTNTTATVAATIAPTTTTTTEDTFKEVSFVASPTTATILAPIKIIKQDIPLRRLSAAWVVDDD